MLRKHQLRGGAGKRRPPATPGDSGFNKAALHWLRGALLGPLITTPHGAVCCALPGPPRWSRSQWSETVVPPQANAQGLSNKSSGAHHMADHVCHGNKAIQPGRPLTCVP